MNLLFFIKPCYNKYYNKFTKKKERITTHMLLKIKNNIVNILLTILLLLMYIIPMAGLDYTSYLSHDARWWLNQYYEYYHTFGSQSPVAFNGFNSSGNVINIAYPQSILKIIETPLVMLHIQDPYIVIGLLTITCVATYVGLYYVITNQLHIDNPYLTSLFMTSILVLTGRGIINSIPQLIATSFILVGIIAIINEQKWWLMSISVAGMIMSSLTTSIIGAITLIIVFFISPTWSKFKKLMAGGLIGLAVALVDLIPILRTTLNVNTPYKDGIQDGLRVFLIGAPTYKSYLFVTIAILTLLIPLLSKNYNRLNILLGVIIGIYILISLFPQFASNVIMAPLQKGTYQRVWTLFAVISLFWLKPMLTHKNKTIIALSTLVLISMSYSTYIYYPISTAVKTQFIQAYKNKDWHRTYQIIDSNINLRDAKSGQLLMNPKIEDTAKFSPDYTPKNATIKNNIISRLTNDTLIEKYGVSKHAVDSNKLKISVNPKLKTTPLGVWSYDFIHYNISTTNGKVISKDGMFYYIGQNPTTIKIHATN